MGRDVYVFEPVVFETTQPLTQDLLSKKPGIFEITFEVTKLKEFEQFFIKVPVKKFYLVEPILSYCNENSIPIKEFLDHNEIINERDFYYEADENEIEAQFQFLWKGEPVLIDGKLVEIEATYMKVNEIGYQRRGRKSFKLPLPEYVTELGELSKLRETFYKKEFQRNIMDKFKEGKNFVAFWY